MRLQHLHLLLGIAQTGSLRETARRLHVTQPALTKALRQLEAEIGAPLVVRSPQGARLAPAGELLATRAAAALREIDRAREEIGWLTGRTTARVALGVSPVAATVLAPAAIARFAARFPQVRLHVVDALYPTAFAQLRAGTLDLAVGPLPPGGAGRDLASHRLLASGNCIVARRGHPLARTRRLAALEPAAWVVVGPAGGPGDPASLGLPAPPRIVLECESFPALVSVLPELDALAMVPRAFAERFAAAMQASVLPLADPLPAFEIHAIHRADAPLTSAAQRLLDGLLQAAEPG